MTCFVINGENMRKICLREGLCYGSVYRYIENGFTPSEAIKLAKERKGRKDNHLKYFIDGINLTDWCRKYGITYNNIIRRMLYCGWSIERATKYYLEKKKSKGGALNSTSL